MPDWLELELAEHLAPVQAPDALWDRIQNGAAATRPAPRRLSWAAMPVAAIVTLMVAAATLWLVAKGQQPALDLRQLAAEQLREGGPLDLESSDPDEINRWMRQEAGVEVALASKSGVRLVGARVIQRGGARIGAVAYEAGGEPATLLVARVNMPVGTAHGQLLWRAKDQVYALASANAEHPDAACLLCHAL